jgi:mannitol/fructose-specific phosphotransferase system IIA component
LAEKWLSGDVYMGMVIDIPHGKDSDRLSLIPKQSGEKIVNFRQKVIGY